MHFKPFFTYFLQDIIDLTSSPVKVVQTETGKCNQVSLKLHYFILLYFMARALLITANVLASTL